MSTPINPALLIAGPAIVQYRSATFYSAGNIQLIPKRTTFQVGTARYGNLEEREDTFTYEVRFTPTGRLIELEQLYPYGSAIVGELVHAVASVSSIDTATNIVTFTSLARFRAGSPVRLATTGTAPAGTTAGTLYYLRPLSDTTGTLHTSEANAAAGTSAVDITSSGSGTHKIIEEEYLVLHTFAGEKYTFHNAAIVQSPELNLAANRTILGEVVFECFRKFTVDPTNAASFYTKTTASVTDTGFDPENILTEAIVSFAWGASAPWSDMKTTAGIRASFPLQLAAWGDDAAGVSTRKITSLGAELRARPIGLSSDDILAKLLSQSTGAGRGRRITSADPLLVATSSVTLTLYGAILADPGALNHDPIEERTGELLWRAQRVVATGVAGPLYEVAEV